MTNFGQLARSVMGRPAGFFPDKATRQFLEELKQLLASNCSIENNRPVCGDAVSLEDVLTKIQSNCCNFLGGVPFLSEDDFYSMPQSAKIGCRRHPPHPRLSCQTRLRRNYSFGLSQIRAVERLLR